MTYLASCPGKCSQFSGSTGNVWVKIHQAGYDASQPAPWASKRLPTQNSTWEVRLPSTIAPGEYILRYAPICVLRSRPFFCISRTLTPFSFRRHEILGLQRTNKRGDLAQFYPSCHQITITGSGTTKLPAGIALPGAYRADDSKSVGYPDSYATCWGAPRVAHNADRWSRFSWNIGKSQQRTPTRPLVGQSGATTDGNRKDNHPPTSCE